MASDKDINNVTKDENKDENKDEPSTQKPEKSGWLFKRTKTSKQWERKWFALKETTIFYGNSPEVSGAVYIIQACRLLRFANK
jgi:hypothetical protein